MPIAIVVAIAAYGAFLYVGHQAAVVGQITPHYSQRLGTAATKIGNARVNAANGMLEIGRFAEKDAHAEWELDPSELDSHRNMSIRNPKLFIAGLGLSLTSRQSFVTITLDGRTIATLHPDVTGKTAPFGALDPPIVPLDIAPGYEPVLAFDLPEDDPCLLRPCDLRIDTHGATWIVPRVGLVVDTSTSGHGLWDPFNLRQVFAILAIASALAVLVHVVRTFAFKRSGRREPWRSAVALALFVAAFMALFAYQGTRPRSATNERTERLERLGTQAIAISGHIRARKNNQLLLGSKRSDSFASATWSLPNDEFPQVLPNAGTCTMSLYVSSPNVSGVKTANASVDLNGSQIASLRFLSEEPDFPVERGRFAPAGVRPQPIEMTPLFNPRGLIFPLSESACKAKHWDVGVSIRGAKWTIERVGILARFAPSHESLAPSLIGIIFTIVLLVALLFGAHALFTRVEQTFGPLALLLVLGIFVCALVTHDEWDFPVWLRFIDFVAIGHGNPGAMWGGSLLWPVLTGILAPVLSTIYAATGDASQEVSALFLKFVMALALCTNALVLAQLPKPALRRFYFFLLVLSPYALYELAGGYREIFAGSFFILGASLALRGRYVFATLAFAAATSISESLAAAVFLPAALRLASSVVSLRTIGLALLDIASGVVPIVCEWTVLEPHGAVATTLAVRITAPYRFGGGSWLSTLDGFGLAPAWMGVHAAAVTLVLLALLAAPLVAITLRDVFTRTVDEATRRKRVFGDFVGLIATFFLAYHGIDPSTWYALWIAAVSYFIRFEPFSPFPLYLSALQAFAFYTILGFGDFANATYVMPTNHALLGVLGKPMYVSVLTVNLAILAFYISRLAPQAAPLFGRGSAAFALLFFCAAGAGAVEMYPIDIVFCTAAGLAILITFARMTRLDERAAGRARYAIVDYVGLASAIVVGVWGGTQNPAAGLVAIVAILLGLTYGFGMCDVALTVGGTLLVATQYGFGWVSIGGYVILSLVAVTAIGKARAAALVRNA
jgi:hypothetical protein